MPSLGPWPQELLTPILITFNRSEDLARTLGFWAGGAAKDARMIVLDNASTDQTPAVVERFKARMPRLAYARNAFNIGGPGNILRAVEYSDSEYLWILGDDDTWFLDDVSELVEVLEKGEADVIRLGWLVPEAARGHLCPARELAAVEPLFFPSLSQISSLIIRRSVFLKYLRRAYEAVSDFYPHLVPQILALEEGDLQVHSLCRDLVVHTPSAKPGYFLGDLEWFTGWMRTGRAIRSARLRSAYSWSILKYVTRKQTGWLPPRLVIPMNALRHKALGVPQWPYLFSMVGYAVGLRGVVWVALLVHALVPRPLARWLDRRYRAWAGLAPLLTYDAPDERQRARLDRY